MGNTGAAIPRSRRGVTKARNVYDAKLGRAYSRMPKALLAALAVSFAILVHGEGPTDDEVRQAILDEWKTLYDAGIVQQKPPAGGLR